MLSDVNFWKQIASITKQESETTGPYLAFVASIDGNKVNIYRQEDDPEDAFPASIISPFDCAEDDVVLCVDINRQTVIIGVMRTVSPAALTLDNGIVATSFNSPVIKNSSATNPTVSSTTETVTAQQALTTTIALPVGTWRIYAHGGANLNHSSGDNIFLVIEIDGATDTGRTPSTGSGYIAVVDDHDASVAGDRDVTVRVMYRSTDAGTTTCKAPWVSIMAVRTA